MPIIARGLVPLLVLALWAYAVFDVIATEEARIQNLPKLPWLLIVIFFPPIGPIAWLLLGRPSGASFRIGGSQPRRRRPVGRPFLAPRPDNTSEVQPPAMGEEEQRRYRESREAELERYYEERARREREIEELERRLRSSGAPEPPAEDGPDEPPPPGT